MGTETTILFSTYSFNTAENKAELYLNAHTKPNMPFKGKTRFKILTRMHYSVVHSFLLEHEAMHSADITPMLNCELPLLVSGRGSLD